MEIFTPYSLACLSICSIWLFKNKIAPLFFTLITLIIGFSNEVFSLNAILVISLYFLACWAYFNNKIKAPYKTLLWWIIFALALAFSFHKVIGITNLKIIDNVIVSFGAYPFSLWINLDIIIAALGILIFANLSKSSKLIYPKILLVYLIAALVVSIVALSLGVVTLDIKLPEFWMSFLTINLLCTCVFEEVFYRFFVQGSLQKVLAPYNYGDIIALIIASILFAFEHFPGPPNYLVMVFIAGLFYGYTYKITNRIEASIGLHLLINILHFFLFSYPILK